MSGDQEHDTWRNANEQRIRQQVTDALASMENPIGVGVITNVSGAVDAVMEVVQPMVDLIHSLLGPPVDMAELRRRLLAPRVDARSSGGQMTCGRCGQTWTIPQTAAHVCPAVAGGTGIGRP